MIYLDEFLRLARLHMLGQTLFDWQEEENKSTTRKTVPVDLLSLFARGFYKPQFKAQQVNLENESESSWKSFSWERASKRQEIFNTMKNQDAGGDKETGSDFLWIVLRLEQTSSFELRLLSRESVVHCSA